MTLKSSLIDIKTLIGNAKNAESCRDINALQNILSAVWSDYDEIPNFREYEPLVQGELFRLCGFLLTFLGRSKNINEYQSKAKDFLINALEIFDGENAVISSAETRITFSFCYWNSGEIQEAKDILASIESSFERDYPYHPICLQVKINRLLFLFWDNDFVKAEKLIEKINDSVNLCADIKIKILFHTEAAVVYKKLSDLETAIYHHSEAIRYCRQVNNLRFIGINLNNLALVYRLRGDFDLSHSYADRAIDLYEELGDQGCKAHVFDSKALIYLNEKKFEHALHTVDDALKIFYCGEDLSGLLDALWTRIRCLFALDLSTEAYKVFGELQHIALERGGQSVAEKYAKLMSASSYFNKNLAFKDEVASFKISLVSKALIENNGEIKKAAKQLKLNNYQHLTDILDNQFPNLRQELGFAKRASRTQKSSIHVRNRNKRIVKEDSRKVVQLKVSDIRHEKAVRKLILPEIKEYLFDFDFDSPTFGVYRFTQSQMQEFGVNEEAVVAVFPIEENEIREGKLILVNGTNGFIVDTVKWDRIMKFHYINDLNGAPILLDEVKIIGTPSGYCPASKSSEEIEFTRLKIKK